AAGFVAGWIVGRLLSPLVESLSEGTAAMENPGVLMLLASMPLVLSVLFAFAGSGIGAWIKRSMDSDLGQGIDAIAWSANVDESMTSPQSASPPRAWEPAETPTSAMSSIRRRWPTTRWRRL